MNFNRTEGEWFVGTRTREGGFTHESGYFVQAIPTLTNTVDLFGTQLPIFKIIQHSSTVIGGLVIIFAILKMPANKDVSERFNIKYWIILTVLTLTIISIRFLCGLDYKLYGQVIVTGISAGLISLILTSWLTKRNLNWC